MLSKKSNILCVIIVSSSNSDNRNYSHGSASCALSEVDLWMCVGSTQPYTVAYTQHTPV